MRKYFLYFFFQFWPTVSEYENLHLHVFLHEKNLSIKRNENAFFFNEKSIIWRFWTLIQNRHKFFPGLSFFY